MRGVFGQATFDRVVGLLLLAGFVIIRIWDPAPVEILRLKGFDFFHIKRKSRITSNDSL